MNKILIAAAAFASLGLSVAAHAESRDPAERAAYNETVRTSAQYQVQAPVVVEGRNVAAPSTTAVEPYIAQQIQQNARSTH